MVLARDGQLKKLTTDIIGIYEQIVLGFIDQNVISHRRREIKQRNSPKITQLKLEHERISKKNNDIKKKSKNACYKRVRNKPDNYDDKIIKYEGILANLKKELDRLHNEIATIKSVYDKKYNEFQNLIFTFYSLVNNYATRAEVVNVQNQDIGNCRKKHLAIHAGLPSQYLDNFFMSYDIYGNANFLFGGINDPKGPDHGHHTINLIGEITYLRPIACPHGHHNFVTDTTHPKLIAKLDPATIALRSKNQKLNIDNDFSFGGCININNPTDIICICNKNGDMIFDRTREIGYMPPYPKNLYNLIESKKQD